jgi:hypothetical protein
MKEVPLGEEVEEQTSCGWGFGFGAARNGRELEQDVSKRQGWEDHINDAYLTA